MRTAPLPDGVPAGPGSEGLPSRARKQAAVPGLEQWVELIEHRLVVLVDGGGEDAAIVVERRLKDLDEVFAGGQLAVVVRRHSRLDAIRVKQILNAAVAGDYG